VALSVAACSSPPRVDHFLDAYAAREPHADSTPPRRPPPPARAAGAPPRRASCRDTGSPPTSAARQIRRYALAIRITIPARAKPRDTPDRSRPTATPCRRRTTPPPNQPPAPPAAHHTAPPTHRHAARAAGCKPPTPPNKNRVAWLALAIRITIPARAKPRDTPDRSRPIATPRRRRTTPPPPAATTPAPPELPGSLRLQPINKAAALAPLALARPR
jgi:hypothetical protein